MTLKNVVEAWAMSSSKYALAAVANVVDQLKSRGLEHMMPKNAANQRPELMLRKKSNSICRTADYHRETYGQRVRIPVVITCNLSCL